MPGGLGNPKRDGERPANLAARGLGGAAEAQEEDVQRDQDREGGEVRGTEQDEGRTGKITREEVREHGPPGRRNAGRRRAGGAAGIRWRRTGRGRWPGAAGRR